MKGTAIVLIVALVVMQLASAAEEATTKAAAEATTKAAAEATTKAAEGATTKKASLDAESTTKKDNGASIASLSPFVAALVLAAARA